MGSSSLGYIARPCLKKKKKKEKKKIKLNPSQPSVKEKHRGTLKGKDESNSWFCEFINKIDEF
jgi:hypothetical protein